MHFICVRISFLMDPNESFETDSCLSSTGSRTGIGCESPSTFANEASESDDDEILYTGRAMWKFDARAYGPEYMSLTAGERVFFLKPPEGVDAEGWEYGLCPDGWRKGWFPPLYVTVWL